MLRTARLALLGILLLGVLGTVTELVLLEHYEEWKQWLPIALLALGTISIGFAARSRNPTVRRLHELLMGLFCISGALGVYFHYAGNVEFELERTPEIGAWELFKSAMEGATPVLAPGVMLQFGLLGLLLSYLFGARVSAVSPSSATHDA